MHVGHLLIYIIIGYFMLLFETWLYCR